LVQDVESVDLTPRFFFQQRRAETCRTLQRLCSSRMDTAVRPPRFVVVDAPPLDRAELATIVAKAPFSYPLICKPIAACGEFVLHEQRSAGSLTGKPTTVDPVLMPTSFRCV
jgi:hypothetical protein